MATLDTKLAEVSFVAAILKSRGRDVEVIDVGTSSVQAERSSDPASLLAAIGQRARATLNELHETGRVTSVLGIAGGKGSGVFGDVIADLPYGFPKLLVSSARPALLAELAGRADVMLYPTIVDLFGVNGFTERVLTNAANAAAAMEFSPRRQARRKIVAITAFGVTTPAVTRCTELLAAADIETIVFPANGAGGRKMEALIEAGEFDGVLDLTTTELADELVGGTASAGPERLTAAGRRGIPQVVAPGAVDMVNFGIPSSVPGHFAERKFYSHTPYTTLMRTTAKETREIGRRTGVKLGSARGPVLVLWPAAGVSDYDREGGVFSDPAANRAWLDGLKAELPESVDCREMPFHINDPQFAEAAFTWLLRQIETEVSKNEDV
ncbi:Tm-1-like ATP-binding domain-containing protein [Rhizobium sp.]